MKLGLGISVRGGNETMIIASHTSGARFACRSKSTADDERHILATTELMLVFYKAQVVSAASALEGLERLQTFRPDVIISDVGMPGMEWLPIHPRSKKPCIAERWANPSAGPHRFQPSPRPGKVIDTSEPGATNFGGK